MNGPTPLEQLESALRELGPSTLLGGILLLIASLHIPLLNYPLVYDDGWVLITNGFLREPDWALLTSPDALSLHVPDAFRPTSVVLDVLSYRIFGLRAGAHHALSIALHLGVCASLWAWLRRLGASISLCGAATLLFGVTALHAEVIAVVSYREDLLAAVFGLGAMILATDAVRSPSLARCGAALLAASILSATACGAKLSAAAFPLVWITFEGLHPLSPQAAGTRTRRFLGTVALGVGVLVMLWHRQQVTGGLSPYELNAGHGLWSERVGQSSVWAASLQIQLTYLGQVLLPLGLSPEYADFGASWHSVATLLAALGLGSLLILAVAMSGRGPAGRLFSACVLSAFALMLPTANLVSMPNMRADRFTYLMTLATSIGLGALALALGARSQAKQDESPGLPLMVLAPLLLLCTVQASFQRAATSAFFSNTTMWESAQRRAPDSARARAMYGLMRLAAGDGRAKDDPELRSRVEADCRAAEVLDPLEARTHVCWARLASQLGDKEEAYRRFSRAIALDPGHSANWIGARAQLALELDAGAATESELRSRRSRALAEVDQALTRFPYAEELHLIAGKLAHRLGEPERAAGHYERARSLRPERWESVAAMLELQLDLGHIPGAHQLWLQEAKLLKHANPAVRAHLQGLIHDGMQLGLTPNAQRKPSSSKIP